MSNYRDVICILLYYRYFLLASRFQSRLFIYFSNYQNINDNLYSCYVRQISLSRKVDFAIERSRIRKKYIYLKYLCSCEKK